MSKAESRPRRFGWRVVMAAVLIVAAGSVAVWAFVPRGQDLVAAAMRSLAPETGATPPAAGDVRGLRVVIVRLAPETTEKSFTGTVVARFETPMAFRVGGKVQARSVEVGQHVRAGDLLMALDPADLEAGLKAAEAALSAAQAGAHQAATEEARQAALLARGWVAQSSYDRAKAAADIARGQVSAAAEQVVLARNSLSYARLVATEDGIVTSIAAETGQVVAAGQPVLTVVRPGSREAEVAVPEGQIADLTDWAATVSSWADPARREAATLREVAPEADPASRTYRARFSLEEDGAAGDLGSTVTVHLRRETRDPVADLPASALFFRGGSAHVWTIAPNGDRVDATPVRIIRLGAERVILSGLTEGAAVVTLGVHRLDEGLPVRVIEVTEGGEDGA